MQLIPFTFSDFNNKKYTIADAVQAAKDAMVDQTAKLDLSAIINRSDNEAITLFQLNVISERIVLDTIGGK